MRESAGAAPEFRQNTNRKKRGEMGQSTYLDGLSRFGLNASLEPLDDLRSLIPSLHPQVRAVSIPRLLPDLAARKKNRNQRRHFFCYAQSMPPIIPTRIPSSEARNLNPSHPFSPLRPSPFATLRDFPTCPHRHQAKSNQIKTPHRPTPERRCKSPQNAQNCGEIRWSGARIEAEYA